MEQIQNIVLLNAVNCEEDIRSDQSYQLISNSSFNGKNKKNGKKNENGPK